MLAYPTCNHSKSVTLAGRPHVERSLEQLVRNADDVAQVGLAAAMVVDTALNRQVAAWGYLSAVESASRAWLASARYEMVDAGYRGYFGA